MDHDTLLNSDDLLGSLSIEITELVKNPGKIQIFNLNYFRSMES